MDQLKHFIDTHRDAFEDDRLPAGHLERFEKKLPTSHTRHTLLYSMCALLAAASIALLFLVKLYPAGTEQQGAEASSCMLKEVSKYRRSANSGRFRVLRAYWTK